MERRKSGEASESGFTLIELLIVIVVLGILAAIVVFSLTGVSGQSKQAACTSDAKSVEIAADAFQAASPTGAYPTNITTDLVPNYLHAAPGTGQRLHHRPRRDNRRRVGHEQHHPRGARLCRRHWLHRCGHRIAAI